MMSVLSKLKGKTIVLGLATALATVAVCPAFASEATTTIEVADSFEVAVNDIIDGVDGKERVVSSFDDGRYATVSLKDAVNPSTCPHTEIMGMGKKYQQKVSFNKSDSTYCYKYRYWEEGRCVRCGKQGFKIYDASWTNVKHKYKLFGNTCTECGYVK